MNELIEKMKPIKKQDYYKILGVSKTSTTIEIKRAYQDKLKNLHPDKLKHLSSTDKKDALLKYKQVREAGDVLSDVVSRKEYDTEQNLELKDYSIHKKEFEEFLSLQKKEELKVKPVFETIKSEPIALNEYEQLIENYELSRRDDYTELLPDKLFKNEFNNEKFNSFFEKKKKNDNIVKYDKIFAHNDGLEDNVGNFINDTNNVEFNDKYTSIDNGFINIKEQDEIEDTDELQKLEKLQELSLDDLINERNKDLNNKDIDYKSVLSDEYGISKHFGYILGKNNNTVTRN